MEIGDWRSQGKKSISKQKWNCRLKELIYQCKQFRQNRHSFNDFSVSVEAKNTARRRQIESRRGASGKPSPIVLESFAGPTENRRVLSNYRLVPLNKRQLNQETSSQSERPLDNSSSTRSVWQGQSLRLKLFCRVHGKWQTQLEHHRFCLVDRF